jgi:pimeloyl-ACP methyl ester carboxylesterase
VTVPSIATLLVVLALSSAASALNGCRSVPVAPERLAWAPDATVAYAEVDGVRLRYAAGGEGRPVVLLHTLRTHLSLWQKVFPQLTDDYRVYALDFPGHGFSDIPDGRYDARRFREAAAGFLEAADLEDAVVVGESIGGAVALQLAGQGHPRLGAAVALNPYDYAAGRGVRRGGFVAGLLVPAALVPGLGELAMFARPGFVVDAVLLGGVHDDEDFPPELMAEIRSIGNRPGYSRMFLSLLRNGRSWERGRDLYGGSAAPVLVAWGEHDWSAPDERARTEAAVGGAGRVRTVGGAGHSLSLDDPDAVVRAVRDAAGRSLAID